MKSNISVKRIICFLLAVMMLLAAVGCKESKKSNKKKVVVRDKVIVRDNGDNNTSSVNSDDSTFDNNNYVPTTTRGKRALIKAEEEEETVSFDELHKETFKPEFESKNVAWNGPEGYVIVYSTATDKNGATTNARVLAEKLKTFFSDNDKVNLSVYKDTDPALAGVEKMILVGDTAYYKSSLKETEFAVNLVGSKLVFEGGHFAMVEKAVDWFRTISREKGKVATLKGTQDDFTSTLTIDGQKYVYVWGDEFDGEELVDESKWQIGKHMPSNPDLAYIKNKDVCYVENGRLRMTAIRYLAEDSDAYGFATCGSYDTSTTMAFKKGYLEFNARLSYTQGILPPLWLMSNPDEGDVIPKEQYKAAWTIEFDIFETFGNGKKWDVSIHKYYKPYDVTIGGQRYNNGITYQAKDAEGNTVNKVLWFGEDITDKFIFKESQYATWGTITSWRNHYDATENKKQEYVFEGEELEKLNDTYHTYGLLDTETGYKMFIDGKVWLERDWDTAWDGVDGFDFNNNNGFGYNLYYYLIMNQWIYTPESSVASAGQSISDTKTLPISSFIDSVRLYQLPDKISVESPAYSE